MIVIAFTPWASHALRSEIAFDWSKPAPATHVVTFGHLAASLLAAANEACDQALMPPPS